MLELTAGVGLSSDVVLQDLLSDVEGILYSKLLHRPLYFTF